MIYCLTVRTFLTKCRKRRRRHEVIASKRIDPENYTNAEIIEIINKLSGGSKKRIVSMVPEKET